MNNNLGVLGDILLLIHRFLNTLIPIIILLGVVLFVWGVVRYVIADSEEAKKKGRDSIISGIIGFAVIVGLWGLVRILVTTFDLQGANIAPIQGGPMVPIGAETNTVGLGKILVIIHNFLNATIPIIIALGVVYFVWGIVQYVIAGGEEAKKQGRDRIIYGLIGFAVIFGLWGLVSLLIDTFGLGVDLIPIENPVDTSCMLSDKAKIQDVLCYITTIIGNTVIPLIFAIAGTFFVWGAVKFFIIGAGEESKRAQGREFMIWGIIALAVMLSVWGIVNILTSTFGINRTVLPQVKP